MLTEIKGVRVGHATNREGETGCTVVLTEEGFLGGVSVRGGAPGTRETALLNPMMKMDMVHAILLTGGSAFGLDAATGVMKYLEEREVGYDTGVARVPIVPAAVIFDLAYGKPCIRPDADMGYRACQNASDKKYKTGNIGVGTGATVGKLCGMENSVKSGIGTAVLREDDLIISGLVVANCLGNVYNPETGKLIAGVTDYIEHQNESNITNTTLGVIVTNADLNKAMINKVADMGQNGLARTIKPVNTMSDGDILFALTNNKVEVDVNKVGMLTAEVVSRAVINAVQN